MKNFYVYVSQRLWPSRPSLDMNRQINRFIQKSVIYICNFHQSANESVVSQLERFVVLEVQTSSQGLFITMILEVSPEIVRYKLFA